jgi:serine/threonine protein kinase
VLVLCFTPEVKNSPRAAVWKQLQTLDLSHLQRAKEAFVVGAWRVEVCGETEGVPLDVWRREKPALEDAVVETIVRQLTEAIGVLQASGLVHLGICPGAIFISEPQGKVHCTLGGLEVVTAFEKTLPIAVTSDPLYAPPEAVLLDAHDPGPSLCAWDWWSLGRVVQELILGHPVLDDLPGASATETPAERIARAEKLLLEKDGGMRAGAVEAMPPLKERMDLLLRGLLSSALEVRWGMAAMDSWGKAVAREGKLRHQAHRNQIPLARPALFRFPRGKGLSGGGELGRGGYQHFRYRYTGDVGAFYSKRPG